MSILRASLQYYKCPFAGIAKFSALFDPDFSFAMPKIPLSTPAPSAVVGLPTGPRKLDILESVMQDSCITAEPMMPGAVRLVPANGKITKATADTVENARVYGLATAKRPSVSANTVIRQGVVGGYDLTGVPFDAPVYVDNDGDLSTEAGTVEVIVGRVIALHANLIGTLPDKAIAVELVK